VKITVKQEFCYQTTCILPSQIVLSKSDVMCFFKGCTSMVLSSDTQGTFMATKWWSSNSGNKHCFMSEYYFM